MNQSLDQYEEPGDKYKVLPDREMNRLIAEMVMGWKYRANCWWQADGTIGGALPEYSVNIADAFEVVEKIRENLIDFWPILSGENKWGVKVALGNIREKIFAPTLPSAICIAALALADYNAKKEAQPSAGPESSPAPPAAIEPKDHASKIAARYCPNSGSQQFWLASDIRALVRATISLPATEKAIKAIYTAQTLAELVDLADAARKELRAARETP